MPLIPKIYQNFNFVFKTILGLVLEYEVNIIYMFTLTFDVYKNQNLFNN